MASVIYFIGPGRGENKPLTLGVAATPDEIMSALNAGHGQPFPLEQTNGGKAYVQPSTIAFWREAPGPPLAAGF